MNCPFCKELCHNSNTQDLIEYYCGNKECANKDMTRFRAEFDSLNEVLLSRTFMMEPFYFKVFYQDNFTMLYKLKHCFIIDPIKISMVLDVDMDNPKLILPKLKTISLLS